MQRLAPLLDDQHGIISRQQVLEVGLTENDLRRLIRQRHLVVVHPGVYANHTGALTWQQRAWAAVLYAWPAALSHHSALRAADGPGRRSHDDGAPIQVAVDRNRPVVPQEGVRIHRLAGLSAKTRWNRHPPRLRIEEAAIDVAAACCSELDTVAILSAVVSSRLTTPDRMRTALAGRSRISRRRFLDDVLADVEAGSCSVLEHAYLARVERPHGLPRGIRQASAPAPGAAARRIYRDVLYEEYDEVVELDGAVFHTGAVARDRDLERDLDARVSRLRGIRLGSGQVFERPCQTAEKVASILSRAGWQGEFTRCPACPERRGVTQRVGNLAPGDSESTLSA